MYQWLGEKKKKKNIVEAGVWEAVKRAENVLSLHKDSNDVSLQAHPREPTGNQPSVPRPSLESDHDDRFLAEKKQMGGVKV